VRFGGNYPRLANNSNFVSGLHEKALHDAEQAAILKPAWFKAHLRKGVALYHMARPTLAST